MKVRKSGSRTLYFWDLPDKAADGTPVSVFDLEVTIKYTDSTPYTDGAKAVALDSVIIPAIIKALGGDEE